VNSLRPLGLSQRWLTAKDALADDIPAFTIYLAKERIGDARMALRHFDGNDQRTCYLGTIETRLGELAVLVELPPTEEAATSAVRDSASAIRALDASSYGFDGGRVEASLNAVTGYWTVSVDGEEIADGMSRDDALAIAHKQVES
jgi:hypothetical protein